VVIDCTGFTTSSEIPLLWLKVFFERCPQDFVQGFSRAFILNANNAALKFLRKLYYITTTAPIAKACYTVSSVEELKNHLPVATAQGMVYAGSFSLSPYLSCTQFCPASLEGERSILYNPVAQQSRYGMKLPVSLVVGETHIRVLTVLWTTCFCVAPLSDSLDSIGLKTSGLVLIVT